MSKSNVIDFHKYYYLRGMSDNAINNYLWFIQWEYISKMNAGLDDQAEQLLKDVSYKNIVKEARSRANRGNKNCEKMLKEFGVI